MPTSDNRKQRNENHIFQWTSNKRKALSSFVVQPVLVHSLTHLQYCKINHVRVEVCDLSNIISQNKVKTENEEGSLQQYSDGFYEIYMMKLYNTKLHHITFHKIPLYRC